MEVALTAVQLDQAYVIQYSHPIVGERVMEFKLTWSPLPLGKK